MVERGQLEIENLLEGTSGHIRATPAPRVTSKLVESDSEDEPDYSDDDSDDTDDSESPAKIQNWRLVHPVDWTPSQSAQWVLSLGPRFAAYAPLFSANRVTGSFLMTINEDAIINIGIANFRDRRELFNQAKRLRDITANGTKASEYFKFKMLCVVSVCSRDVCFFRVI